ncbi:YIP1 family protein [Staphylococcus delphini]|uniref:YIP1 family protein n=1 Tax=Staphylococcus delphini TaxID=53344 RepID=UPI0021CEDFF7|nr:YIP1 family protein [Staphylococcus delphini]UXS21660.1 YIP1 family protein [Staphylococcus delphini]UXS57604.1 YIP1 family protein [Staphylococcus delphini]
MSKSNLIFSEHFCEVNNKPRWKLKLFIVIIVIVLSSIISSLAIDYSRLFKKYEITGEQLEQAQKIGQIGGTFSSAFLAIISIFITFTIFLIITKIMRAETSKKVIFSATLSYILITSTISLVVLFIQWVVGISPLDYSITSFNVFDKGNKTLGAINIQNFIAAYVFGIMMYEINQSSKRATLIWVIVYLMCTIGFSLFSSTF